MFLSLILCYIRPVHATTFVNPIHESLLITFFNFWWNTKPGGGGGGGAGGAGVEWESNTKSQPSSCKGHA